VPSLTGALSQPRKDKVDPSVSLNLTDELEGWMHDFSKDHSGAVSMVNFLAYEHGGQEAYFKGYIQSFRESLGPKSGSQPKVFGTVVRDPKHGEEEGWEDVGIVHYPSIWHFAELILTEEYKALDRKYKRGVLKDTGILCVKEVEI